MDRMYYGFKPSSIKELENLTAKLDIQHQPQHATVLAHEAVSSPLLTDLLSTLVMQINVLATFAGITLPQPDLRNSTSIIWDLPGAFVWLQVGHSSFDIVVDRNSLEILISVEERVGRRKIYFKICGVAHARCLFNILFNWFDTSPFDPGEFGRRFPHRGFYDKESTAPRPDESPGRTTHAQINTESLFPPEEPEQSTESPMKESYVAETHNRREYDPELRSCTREPINIHFSLDEMPEILQNWDLKNVFGLSPSQLRWIKAGTVNIPHGLKLIFGGSAQIQGSIHFKDYTHMEDKEFALENHVTLSCSLTTNQEIYEIEMKMRSAPESVMFELVTSASSDRPKTGRWPTSVTFVAVKNTGDTIWQTFQDMLTRPASPPVAEK